MVDGRLAVRVRAAPVDGLANAALVRVIAAAAGVPRTRIALVAGTSSRRKTVEIEGADAAALRALWPGLDV